MSKITGSSNPNWKGGKVSFVCHVCGKTYFKFISQGKTRTKYCSKKCFYNRHPRRTIGTRGYVLIYVPKRGYIRESHLVMETKLGRSLVRGEVVHHINHIKDDNRPENLELFNSQSKHMFFHHSH